MSSPFIYLFILIKCSVFLMFLRLHRFIPLRLELKSIYIYISVCKYSDFDHKYNYEVKNFLNYRTFAILTRILIFIYNYKETVR